MLFPYRKEGGAASGATPQGTPLHEDPNPVQSGTVLTLALAMAVLTRSSWSSKHQVPASVGQSS